MVAPAASIALSHTAITPRGVEDSGRERSLPEKVADEMVLADIMGEVRQPLIVSEEIEVRPAVHVGLADDARRDADGVDGSVEFCVRGGCEHLLQSATARTTPSASSGAAAGGLGRNGHHERELVHEFVGFAIWGTHEERYHTAAGEGGYPHVAVYRPYYIAFGFSECAGYLADLGIGPELSYGWVFIFGVDSGVEVGIFAEELPQDCERGVVERWDAEVYRELGFGV